MPDAPLASTDDLKVRLAGTVIEDAVLAAALQDVSDLARDRAGAAGDLWNIAWTEGVTTSTKVPRSVRVIVLDAARRRVLNPDAYVSESEGDYSYRRAEGTEGDSVFTDDELATLRGFLSSGGFGLTSLLIERPGLAEASLRYLPTNMEGDPLPWPMGVE